ncbi:hemophore-related protein [Mycolicibacterium sp. 624]|uniref:hemophore-related protein n=1 Tax=Mycolicibacterium sp. 624 TaxID=3156314 RepID=UPI00339ADB57
MIALSLSRIAAVVGGVALSLTAGAGLAAAEPDLGPMVNTTCSYEQVMSAANAQDPAAAAQFSGSSQSQGYLRQFLGAPPDQRQQMAAMIMSVPGNQQYLGLMQQIFGSCNNY